MAEESPVAGPFDAEDQDNVLGKLDQLMHRHRPQAAEPESPSVPTLTDALRGTDASIAGSIPTLTDVVSGPGGPVHAAPQKVVSAAGHADALLEAGLALRLAAKLEAQRARLLAGMGHDRGRLQALDELITELKGSLPALVHSALHDETVPGPGADPLSKPNSGNR
jgi:hypothetical protein